MLEMPEQGLEGQEGWGDLLTGEMWGGPPNCAPSYGCRESTCGDINLNELKLNNFFLKGNSCSGYTSSAWWPCVAVTLGITEKGIFHDCDKFPWTGVF